MLVQLQSIRMILADHDKTFTEKKVRLDNTEADSSCIETMEYEISEIQTPTNESTNKTKMLIGPVNDAEIQSRRNNLVFYGVKDQQYETWLESKNTIIYSSNRLIKVNISPCEIERGHRIWSFQPNKCRLIGVNILDFKDNDKIVSLASEFKGTGYSASQGRPARTHLAQKRPLILQGTKHYIQVTA